MDDPFCFRFVVEDSTFHLCNKSKNIDTNFTDYIPVMDMGLFELSLKLTDGLDKSQPLTELSMSNSMLYIRTCSDSCIALMDIIKYFASDGDLQPNQNDTLEETELVRKVSAIKCLSKVTVLALKQCRRRILEAYFG